MRPSGHKISDRFQTDNCGAIPPNLLAIANTESNGNYQKYCRKMGYKEHPARFPIEIPSFFISMLTNPGDSVFDPFAGSAVSGEACERMNRRWICCEKEGEYVKGSFGRFIGRTNTPNHDEDKRNVVVYKISSPCYAPSQGHTAPIRGGGEKRQ